jgi:hypothetical protein
MLRQGRRRDEMLPLGRDLEAVLRDGIMTTAPRH